MCTLVAISILGVLAFVRIEDIRIRAVITLALFVASMVCVATMPWQSEGHHTYLPNDHQISALMLAAMSGIYLARPVPKPASAGAMGRIMGVLMLVCGVLCLTELAQPEPEDVVGGLSGAPQLGLAAGVVVVGLLCITRAIAVAKRARHPTVAQASVHVRTADRWGPRARVRG